MTSNILLFTSLIVFLSCNGQVKNAQNNATTPPPFGTIVAELDTSIWVIFQDSKHRYWFGSNKNGAYCYDGKHLKQFTNKDGLCSNQIRGIQEDKIGTLYFETPQGVCKLEGEKFTSLMPIKSVFNEWKLQPNDLWFKRHGEAVGAYRYDGNKLYDLEFSTISTQEFNSLYAIYSLYKDRQGHIWFGTLGAGVARFDGTSLDWMYEDELGVLADGRAPAIRSILEDKDGSFWFSNTMYQYDIQHSTQKGLSYKKVKKVDDSKQTTKMQLPYYTSAVWDNESIWMTCYNEGIWKYDGKTLSNYTLKEGETKVLPMFVLKDHTGAIWVASDNAGVYKWNGTGFEKFKP